MGLVGSPIPLLGGGADCADFEGWDAGHLWIGSQAHPMLALRTESLGAPGILGT